MKHAEETEQMLSRGEVETLCLLDAVGIDGAAATEVTDRLGLSSTLAVTVSDALETLVSSGLLVNVEGRYKLTDKGRIKLSTQQANVGPG